MLPDRHLAELDDCKLAVAYQKVKGDPATDIPFLMWLLENPDSKFALPGNIGLYNHDCMHLILQQGFTSDNEAYVVGFSMGNDTRTNWIHTTIIKIVSVFVYPKKYRWQRSNVAAFERGLAVGKMTEMKNLNQEMPEDWNRKTVREIRAELGLETEKAIEMASN
jgi:hypothetical protein